MRQNCTHFAFFRTESERELKAMGEEVDAIVGYEQFCRLFKLYTEGKHSYIWVDLIDPSHRRKLLRSVQNVCEQ